MARVQINEKQLNRIITESINRVLMNEEMEDEGLFNRLGSAFRGAKQGYNAQKLVDRGSDDFKQEHDYGDMIQTMDNPLSKMPNTAEEQAAEIYKQYKQYYMEANRLLNLYNEICRKYGLSKDAVGKYTYKGGKPKAAGVDFSGKGKMGGFEKNPFGRKHGMERDGLKPNRGLWEGNKKK